MACSLSTCESADGVETKNPKNFENGSDSGKECFQRGRFHDAPFKGKITAQPNQNLLIENDENCTAIAVCFFAAILYFDRWA